MVLTTQVDQAIARGIEYLSQQQQQSGGFLSQATTNTFDFSTARNYRTVFSCALILQNLSQLKVTQNITQLQHNLVVFLLSQRSKFWSWNYWDRESLEAKTHPYPDDLDDSCAVLAALWLTKPNLITGEVLAMNLRQLTEQETAVGGPYRTWLMKTQNNKVWDSVDLGVNLSIGYWLHLNGVTLPNLTRFFEQALMHHQLTTPYYPRPLPILFYTSRLLQNSAQQQLQREVVDHCKPASPLELALLLLINNNLNDALASADIDILQLTAAQNQDGSWPVACFYTGVHPDNTQQSWAGSKALTTSFALLALNKWALQQQALRAKNDSAAEKLQHQISDAVAERLKGLEGVLSEQVRYYLKQVRNNDAKALITSMPWLCYRAIGAQAARLSPHILHLLSQANVCGWIAYTIYDAVLDTTDNLHALPLANCCLRELTRIYTTEFLETPAVATYFSHVMDRQEAAAAWEMAHYRFNPATTNNQLQLPDFEDLRTTAERSLGQSLSSCSLLLLLGFTPESNLFKQMEQFFQHYLTARQLNDDAHDWEIDLAHGQITAVTSRLLNTPPKLRHTVFWTDTIDWICETIELHLNAAADALNQSPELEHPELLRELLAGPKSAVTKVRAERKKLTDFLHHYQYVE